MCLDKPISRSDYDKGDDSKTDFAYAIAITIALALARKNYSKPLIRTCLVQERTNWENHAGSIRKKAYINRTIEYAVAIVQKS